MQSFKKSEQEKQISTNSFNKIHNYKMKLDNLEVSLMMLNLDWARLINLKSDYKVLNLKINNLKYKFKISRLLSKIWINLFLELHNKWMMLKISRFSFNNVKMLELNCKTKILNFNSKSQIWIIRLTNWKIWNNNSTNCSNKTTP